MQRRQSREQNNENNGDMTKPSKTFIIYLVKNLMEILEIERQFKGGTVGALKNMDKSGKGIFK